MKKGLVYLAVLCLAFFVLADDLRAGTFSAGARSYYAWWDSGMAKMTAQSIETQLRREMDQADFNIGALDGYGDLEVEDPEGHGFIYGPVIGYRTDDKKWDVELAVMWFGSYTTSVDASVKATGTGTFPFSGTSTTVTLPYSTELSIEHRDIDLQGGYMLTDLFRLFAGYKYQSYETGITAEYNFSYFGVPLYASEEFSFTSVMHMPYLGGGVVYGINDWLTAKANLGFGLIVAGSLEQKMKIRGDIAGTSINADYSFDGGKVEMAYCLMGDISFGMNFGGNVNLEVGYRYQRFTFKVKDADLDADGQADDSGSETDLFHGLTFGASYLF